MGGSQGTMGQEPKEKKTIPGLFDCCKDSDLCCSLLFFPCVVYEKNHRQLNSKFDSIWSYLDLFEVIWSYLELFGVIWYV